MLKYQMKFSHFYHFIILPKLMSMVPFLIKIALVEQERGGGAINAHFHY